VAALGPFPNRMEIFDNRDIVMSFHQAEGGGGGADTAEERRSTDWHLLVADKRSSVGVVTSNRPLLGPC